ncbi:glycosyltransferase [Streptococcus suis]
MKISVAMTTFNGKDYVVQQLDSIRTQTVAPQEVIIVDDCSTDGTIDLISEYISSYQLEEWNLILNQENIGWRKNFRKALFRTSGDIIFLCDQDDIWKNDKISQMLLEFKQHSDIELLASNYQVLDFGRKEKVKIKNLDKDDGSLYHYTFKKHGVGVLRPGCTFAIRKDLIDILKKYDMEQFGHDNILWNLAMLRDSLYILNRQLIYFRRHELSTSTPTLELNRERRTKEVEVSYSITQFLLSLSKVYRINKDVLDKIKKLDVFLNKRYQILKVGTLINLFIFQCRYFKYYSTFRNLLSDILVFIR